MNKTLKEIIEANSYLTAEAVMNLADDDGITITVADLKRLELDIKTEKDKLLIRLGKLFTKKPMKCTWEANEWQEFQGLLKQISEIKP